MQKCDVHKALVPAIGQDKRPLASRRAARLIAAIAAIAAKESAAAVLQDMAKAIQVKMYSNDDHDLACLAAISIGGSRLLCVCCVVSIGHCPARMWLKASAAWIHPSVQTSRQRSILFHHAYPLRTASCSGLFWDMRSSWMQWLALPAV